MRKSTGFIPFACLIMLFISGCSQNLIYQRSVAELNQKAQEMLAKGDAAGAIERLESARDLDPQEPNTLYNLGVAYTQQGNLDKAIQSFETLLKINVNADNGALDRLKVLQSLGVVYEQKADETANQAVTAKDKAKDKKNQKDDANAETLKQVSLGYYDKALQAYQELLQSQRQSGSSGISKSPSPASSGTGANEEATDLAQHVTQLQQRIEQVKRGDLKPVLTGAAE